MHSSSKQHQSWKLDDERHKRSATSSAQTSPITTYHDSPGNYMHEKTNTGN